MQTQIRTHLATMLQHLYINPLEKCNLRCKICYTAKTAPILAPEAILDFVHRYTQAHPLKIITFCGGEVFTLKYFPDLVNQLTAKGLFIQIITNGTVDRLTELNSPNNINLIVSIDGLVAYHDQNRGVGNFQKSLSFLKKAHTLGFHTEIFSIVTQQNLPHIDALEKFMQQELQHEIPITYHPRKPPAYLSHHPQSNIVGTTQNFDYLTRDQMRQIMQERNTFPPKDLGCYQIALVSDGRIFGCCEGMHPIGKITDEIPVLIQKMEERLEKWSSNNKCASCLGCTDPTFMCGLKELYN